MNITCYAVTVFVAVLLDMSAYYRT